MKNIIIVGAGGHAKVLIDIARKIEEWNVIGYIDFQDQGEFNGLEYLGNDKDLRKLITKGINQAIIGLGQVNVTLRRKSLIDFVTKCGYKIPSIISPSAIIGSNVVIGEGTQILNSVVINSTVKIGNHCILNTNVVVEHDCEIGNYCHLATRATLCGGVKVGNGSMVGAGAIINQYLSLSENCMIGSNACVINDISESGTYVGIPAKKISKNIL